MVRSNHHPSDHPWRPRTRRAYELGRLGWAAGAGLWILPLVLLGRLFHCQPTLVLPTASLAAITLIALRFRGQEWGRGVAAGFAVGFAVFLIPGTAALLGLCAAGPSPILVRLCALAGIGAGLLIAYKAATCRCRCLPYLASAGLAASTVAAIGCAVAGFSGILGMVAGLTLTASPVALLARAR